MLGDQADSAEQRTPKSAASGRQTDKSAGHYTDRRSMRVLSRCLSLRQRMRKTAPKVQNAAEAAAARARRRVGRRAEWQVGRRLERRAQAWAEAETGGSIAAGPAPPRAHGAPQAASPAAGRGAAQVEPAGARRGGRGDARRCGDARGASLCCTGRGQAGGAQGREAAERGGGKGRGCGRRQCTICAVGPALEAEVGSRASL
mgnify:CR=1 FL=1